MRTTLIFILLTFSLVGCRRRDATIQKELTGTWWLHFGRLSVTNVIAADGTYHCQSGIGPNGPTLTSEGTLIAKNGFLIETKTKDSLNLPMPIISLWQIDRISRSELVLSSVNKFSGTGAVQETFVKVKK